MKKVLLLLHRDVKIGFFFRNRLSFPSNRFFIDYRDVITVVVRTLELGYCTGGAYIYIDWENSVKFSASLRSRLESRERTIIGSSYRATVISADIRASMQVHQLLTGSHYTR